MTNDKDMAARYGFASAEEYRKTADEQNERARIVLMPPRFHPKGESK